MLLGEQNLLAHPVYIYIRGVIKKYQDYYNNTKSFTITVMIVNLLQSSPLLILYTLSSVPAIVGNISGSHFSQHCGVAASHSF